MATQYSRSDELRFNISFLRNNIKSVHQAVVGRNWEWAFRGIRLTLFNILHGLASIYTGDKADFGYHFYVDKYWIGYDILKVETSFSWNQPEWRKFVKEENPRLQDFANLTSSKYPIYEIFNAIECERLWKKRIKDAFGKHERWLQEEWVLKGNYRFELPTFDPTTIWDELGREDIDIIEMACKGLGYLVDMVEDHSNWMLSQKLME